MPASQHPFPVINGLGLVVALASIAGAFGLHLLREHLGRETSRGQTFADGGSVCSLILMLCMVWSMVQPSANVDQLVRENAILVLWSLVYTAMMICRNLRDSVLPENHLKSG